jgi:hypothetical protein
MSGRWYTGNAAVDGAGRRGWLVGHFISVPGEIRSTKDVEIKWGIHRAGEERSAWSTDEYRTTAVILIRGRFRLDLGDDGFLLECEGDYAVWGPGVDHLWRAVDESVAITIRWPSLPA